MITFIVSIAVGVLLGMAIGLLIVGERSPRSSFDLPLPAASVRRLRRKRIAARADLSRVLKGSRASWFTVVLVLLVVASCTDPNLETCETARSQSYELQPPFACRIEQWPDGATVYPIKGGADFVQLLDAGAAYVGPAQYDTTLREPGVLAALPDGDCEWLPCHGGVPPVDAGVAALPRTASCPLGFYVDCVDPSGEYTCRSKPVAGDPLPERQGIIVPDEATEVHGRIACAAGELAYAPDFRHVGCRGGQS